MFLIQGISPTEKAKHGLLFAISAKQHAGLSVSLMSMMAWANFRLAGIEPQFNGSENSKNQTCNVDKMIEFLGQDVIESRWKTDSAISILHKSAFSEKGIFGPLMMFSGKTGSFLSITNHLGICTRLWLKKRQAHQLNESTELKRIYELVIFGKRHYS